MLEDRQGNLWLATQGSGLVKFDREHRRFIRYVYKAGDSDGLAEDRLTTLFEDRDGSHLGSPFRERPATLFLCSSGISACEPKAEKKISRLFL